MRRLKFENENYYHVYNRGVDKRTTFANNSDFVRFLYTLYICNDSEIKIKNIKRSFDNVQGSALHKGMDDYKRSENRFVDIVSFCLMPNHYHLILKQLEENGISKFMHRVGTAYTMAFNKKHERTGILFQGRFRAKLILKDDYLLSLTKYIHLNPISLMEPGWKEKGIKNWKQAKIFLESYKWSSYLDYIGKKNFPSLMNKGLVDNFFKSPKDYENFVKTFTPSDLEHVL